MDRGWQDEWHCVQMRFDADEPRNSIENSKLLVVRVRVRVRVSIVPCAKVVGVTFVHDNDGVESTVTI